MKKKTKKVSLPKISADTIATNLKRRNGLDKSRKIASYYAKTMSSIGTDDLSSDFFDIKDIQKDGRIWTQVSHILANQKGYGTLSILALVSLLVGTLTLGVSLYNLHNLIDNVPSLKVPVTNNQLRWWVPPMQFYKKYL